MRSSSFHPWSAIGLSVVVFTMLAVLAGCEKATGTGPEAEPLKIAVSKDLSRVSIVVENVSRARVLDELHSRYDIEVRTMGLADEPISVHISDVSLHEAIATLLPPNTRYALRVGDRELALLPPEKDDQKDKPVQQAPELPTKDESKPLPPSERTRVKVPVDEWKPPETRVASGLKPQAAAVQEVPKGHGAKLERRATSVERTARLNFVISAPDQVQLVGATVVDGPYVASATVRGPLVVVLRDISGKVFHVETLVDPLEVHSYRVDGTHSVSRAKEGAFGIWIPGELLVEKRLAALVLEFYDARGIALPEKLDVRSVSQVIEKASKLGAIKGKAIFDSVKEVMQR